jgi:hypothetical protein
MRPIVTIRFGSGRAQTSPSAHSDSFPARISPEIVLFALAAGSALRQLSPCDYVRFWPWAPECVDEFTVYKKGWLATLHRNPVKNLILFSYLPTKAHPSTNLP